MEQDKINIIDFGPVQDKTKNLIKVIGVGGGGCNAVKNMYAEGIKDVSFAVCNTDSQSLSKSPIPVKIPLGKTGLGAGSMPELGRKEAEESIDSIKKMLSDSTGMVFVTAGMGGGTGTGAAPIVAGVAKSMGLLTIGIVTIPFYFEKEKKIIKALKGVEEMRRNVDSLLIINNERICDIYSNDRIPVKEAFKEADNILKNAVKSISELITVEGGINLDFCDVETTMKSGGGAIMAIGRAGGERRVQNAILNALDSPLLYGCDINRAKRILFNIYTSDKMPLFVDEMQEIDAFMDELDPQIEVIWGVSDDDSLEEDAKITILATGMDSDSSDFIRDKDPSTPDDNEHYRALIKKLYSVNRQTDAKPQDTSKVAFDVNGTKVDENGETEPYENNKNVTSTDTEEISPEVRDAHHDDDKTLKDSTEIYINGAKDRPLSVSELPVNTGKTFLERLKERIKSTIDNTLYE